MPFSPLDPQEQPIQEQMVPCMPPSSETLSARGTRRHRSSHVPWAQRLAAGESGCLRKRVLDETVSAVGGYYVRVGIWRHLISVSSPMAADLNSSEVLALLLGHANPHDLMVRVLLTCGGRSS